MFTFFATPTGIAVIAAASSFTAGLLGVGISAWTSRSTHTERLVAEERLAAKKFTYEQQQTVFKRRFELAEQMLTNAYRFRSMMNYVRSGISFGEGDSRAADPYESDGIRHSRNSYFVPIERLNKENEFVSAMFAQRTICEAHFGEDCKNAYDLFTQALHNVRISSSLLVEWTGEIEAADKETMQNLKCDIWQPMAKHSGKDEIGTKIEKGVSIVENLSRPVLVWIP